MSFYESISKPLSVSELNNQIKGLLEGTFTQVFVEGEISNLTSHSSGHTYFSIKDENSSIRCALFRGNAAKLKFKLEAGLKVLINGAISVYTPRGDYSINCFSIEPSGIGSLALAYEQLKKKLISKGYFDPLSKKKLPRFPRHIIIVTSGTGAAIQDMLRVAQKRWNLLKVTLIDTLVQGDEAKYQIARNIAFADTLEADIIIVGRGGGSIEDLWAFNEEIVADAIYCATTPIVSAVGHEVDVVISDFVADLRAPTPSAAMEMVLPDSSEMIMMLDGMLDELDRAFVKLLQKKEIVLSALTESFRRHSFEQQLANHKKELSMLQEHLILRFEQVYNNMVSECSELKRGLDMQMAKAVQKKETELLSLQKIYEGLNPKDRSVKGYAQVVKDGKIRALCELKLDDEFELQDSDTSLVARVIMTK